VKTTQTTPFHEVCTIKNTML